MIETYIKTNRQVFFNGDTAFPLTNMYMCWWCDYLGSPTGATVGTANVTYKIVNYFKEVN